MTTIDKLKYLLSRIENAPGDTPHIANDIHVLNDYIIDFENGKIGLADDEIKMLNQINRKYRDVSVYTDSKYNFKNKHFAFTGFRDAKLVELLNNKYGSIVHNTITGSTKLDYLICTDTSHQTVKMKRAQQQGAVIMTREELLKLI